VKRPTRTAAKRKKRVAKRSTKKTK
jgi:hypothetical protein